MGQHDSDLGMEMCGWDRRAAERLSGQIIRSVLRRRFRGLGRALEIQAESKLNQSGIVQRLIDYAETGRCADVLRSSIFDAAQIELRVIEQIEKLCPELQFHAFTERHREVLHD